MFDSVLFFQSQLRCCSDGPNSATSAVPPSVAKVFEDFVSYLKAPKVYLLVSFQDYGFPRSSKGLLTLSVFIL